MLRNCLAKRPTDLLECKNLSNSNFIIKLRLYNHLCYSAQRQRPSTSRLTLRMRKKCARATPWGSMSRNWGWPQHRGQRAGHSPTVSGYSRWRQCRWVLRAHSPEPKTGLSDELPGIIVRSRRTELEAVQEGGLQCSFKMHTGGRYTCWHCSDWCCSG